MSRPPVVPAVLASLLAASLALTWLLGADPGRRNLEVMPEMVTSVPFEAFSANPVLAGGTTSQPPPEGTVASELGFHFARGGAVARRLPLPYAATAEDALRAGQELVNPLSPSDVRAAERGGQVFAAFCVPCHGAGGDGDGPVARKGFPAPPSLRAAHAREMADGQLFHVITYGQGNMPGHAAQLAEPDRWSAVLRVRQLQAEAPTAPAGDEAPGAEPAGRGGEAVP